MNLPPYRAMRDSGLPWAPRIPEHWDVRRNGGLFGQRVETGFPDLPVLEVSLRTGVRVRDMENLKRKQMMSQREKYKRAAKGDIAYNMMRMWQGALGVAPADGLISPAYVVARPYANVNSAYYAYLYRTDAYLREVNKFSRGIVSDRNRLYWAGFKQMPALVPPPDEQKNIVAYLRAQDAKIGRFIRDKRRLIEVLNEQKQTLIHRAVTRSIDPNVQLKPSGVDWLGEVPEHWFERRLKFVADNITEQTDTQRDGEIYLALEHVEGWTGKMNPPPGATAFSSTVKRFQADDVLFGKLRPYLAKVVRPLVPGVCVSEFFVLRTKTPEVLPQYLELLLRTKKIVEIVNSTTVGAKMPRADWTTVGNMRLPFPPMQEQLRILSALARDTSGFDATTAQVKDEIRLMQEYRDRLISDVVTGQVDVRGWTPGPDDVLDEEAMLGGEDDEALEDQGAEDDDDGHE